MMDLWFSFSTLRLQKRLSAAVLKCGKNKIWLDPNETSEISNANSRKCNPQEDKVNEHCTVIRM